MNVTRNLTVNVTRNAAAAFAAIVVLVSMVTLSSNNDRPLSADASPPQDLAEFASAAGPALPSVSAAATVLQDSFNRADSDTVGFAWVEVEAAGSSVSIADDRLFFDTATDGINRPLIRRTFTPAVTTGTVQWDFDIDWTRTGTEVAYRFLMQMGNSATMNDNSQDTGTGVNLVWTNIDGVDQRLGYRQGNSDTFLTGVSGPTHITVVANLDSTPKTYSVAVNSSVIQSNIPFFSNVPSLNTVRFLTDNLHQQNISGRTIDNLVVFSSDVVGNTPPAAQTQSVNTDADTPLTVNLTATDTQQCQLAINIVTQPANGSLGPLANQPCAAGNPNSDTATVVYTPNAGYTGPDSFTWRASDGQVFSSNATVNITVGGGSPTVIFSDNFDRSDSTTVGSDWVELEPTGATVSIAGNQLFFDDTSDAVNRPLVKRSFSPVSTGTVQWDFDIDWTRTGPEATYRFLMQLGNSAAMNDGTQNDGAAVNLIWTTINGAHESLGYRQGSVDNALAVVNEPATISVVANLANSTYSVAVNDSTVGTDIPFHANVTSLDTVRFLTSNLNEQFISGRTVDNVSVSSSGSPPGNTPPAAQTQSVNTNANAPLTVTLTATDSEQCQLDFSIVTGPANGSLGSLTNQPCAAGSPNSDTATVVYTPNAGYTGPDSFTWRAGDGQVFSGDANVNITVGSANTPPVAQAQSVTTDADTPLTVTLTANDTQQCQLAFNVVTQPANGSLGPLANQPCAAGNPNSDTATVVYTPNAGYTGPDSFTWRASDGQVFSSNATVNITVGGGSATDLFSDDFNRGNIAAVGNGWVEVEEAEATVSIGNDQLFFDDTSDVANRPLVRHSFSPISTGTVQWDFDFHWTRTGNEGTYRFLMQLGSSAAMSDNSQNGGAGVNLVWTSINGTQESLGYRQGSADTALAVVDEPATISVVANLANRTYSVAINGSTVGSVIPFDASVTSLDTVRFLTDALNDLHISDRTIDNLSISSSGAPPGNVAPAAHNQAASTIVNQSVALQLSYTDTDGPGPFTFTILTQPANGQLTGSDANRTYTPDNNFTGSDSFTWRVNDGEADSNEATFTLTVDSLGGPQNLQPVNGQTNVSTAPTLEIGCSPMTTDAAQYQISTTAAFSSLAYDSGEDINDICNHLAFAGLDTDTDYFWRGRIKTGTTWSPYSQPTSFTTVNAAPVNNVFLDGGVFEYPDDCPGRPDTITADSDIRGSALNPTGEPIREWNQGCQDVIRTGRRLPNQATDEIFRSLVQFDIDGGLSNPNAVINAYIELTGWHHTDSNHLFNSYNSMYELNKPWDEGSSIQDVDAADGEVSWSYSSLPDEWAVPGVASASDTNPNADRSATPLVHRVTTNLEGKKSYWSSKNLVDAVKGWISDPASNHGVFIKADDESVQATLHQASKENPNVDFRPKLVIVSTESAVNGAPVAQSQSLNTGVNQPLSVVLAFSDSDGPGPYVFTIQSQPSNGVLSGSGANRTYTPNNNFTGSDSFTWRVNDGLADSNTATVNITVAQAGPILSDNFNRADSNTVGGGWSEVEPAETSAAIANQALHFADTSDIVNRPLVKRTFPQVATGTLQWDFDFDWTRIGAEGIYSFLMQLGSGMSDASQNGGAGVNLVWTSIDGDHQSLGFRQGGNDTLLTEVSGPTQIRVVANLAARTYSVAVDGTVIESDIAFDANVPLDTVRFFTDQLNEENFAGRTIDNVTITGP